MNSMKEEGVGDSPQQGRSGEIHKQGGDEKEEVVDQPSGSKSPTKEEKPQDECRDTDLLKGVSFEQFKETYKDVMTHEEMFDLYVEVTGIVPDVGVKGGKILAKVNLLSEEED